MLMVMFGGRPSALSSFHARNPFRMSVDSETGTAYWGEVGPDSGRDGERGPRGYCEINRAATAGYYGWPYFVADNNACPEDKGFAIKGWTAVRFENVDILTEGPTGMAMGNYFFTTPEGDEVKVEYSFGYMLDEAGKVRINLHHSSMPYAP